jgi:hypothetical protein
MTARKNKTKAAEATNNAKVINTQRSAGDVPDPEDAAKSPVAVSPIVGIGVSAGGPSASKSDEMKDRQPQNEGDTQ